MSDKKEDPIEQIKKSPLREVLVRGFAELIKVKPDFPVEYLGHWLKEYSNNQARQKELDSTREEKHKRVVEMQQNTKFQSQKTGGGRHYVRQIKRKKEKNQKEQEEKFVQKVTGTKFLGDLLVDYLPESIEVMCNDQGVGLTGCYVGQLKYRHKRLEEHNFEPGAELDVENPKIIEYLGASKSHAFMIEQILPNETGRSYEVFKEEEPPAEEAEEGKPVEPKKKYLYVPFVQKDEKMYFFRFPKLGSYACFPLKVKSCLYSQTFDKGIGDYKNFVKNKEELEKEFNEKVTEARTNFEEARRKYEEHELNEEDPNSVNDHAALKDQNDKAEQALKEIEDAPPVIEQFNYNTKLKEYIVCVDTMGKDTQLPESILDFLQDKVDFFREKWQEKEHKMLLDDILQYIEDEVNLESQMNYFRDQEQGIIQANESQIKEQYANREKEAEYELTLLKVGRLLKVLQEQPFQNSLNAYLNYNIPKFQEIVQITLMILGYKKTDINLPRSNSLDVRKCIRKTFIQKMMTDLENYELRRESSKDVEGEYKINKLLERLEKLDSEAVGHYNSWLFGLLMVAKNICWTRIQCRDAKIEAHQAKTKAMVDRDAEIVKYEQDYDKALETAKAEVTEESPPFNEQEWIKTYISENPKPEKLNVEELKQFLDIE